MGLFSSIGNTISGAVTSPILDPVVGVPLALGKTASNAAFGSGPPQSVNSMTNPVDPQLQQMQQQQTQNAVNFGNNLPAYEKQQQNTATDTSRQQLATQLAGTTQNSNARGLLYGGYNQDQQAQDVAKNQANLAQTNTNINTNAQNQLSGMQSQALGTGMALNASEQQQQEAAYQAALQQQLAQNQAFGSFLGGAGAGAGLLALG